MFKRLWNDFKNRIAMNSEIVREYEKDRVERKKALDEWQESSRRLRKVSTDIESCEAESKQRRKIANTPTAWTENTKLLEECLRKAMKNNYINEK